MVFLEIWLWVYWSIVCKVACWLTDLFVGFWNSFSLGSDQFALYLRRRCFYLEVVASLSSPRGEWEGGQGACDNENKKVPTEKNHPACCHLWLTHPCALSPQVLIGSQQWEKGGGEGGEGRGDGPSGWYMSEDSWAHLLRFHLLCRFHHSQQQRCGAAAGKATLPAPINQGTQSELRELHVNQEF